MQSLFLVFQPNSLINRCIGEQNFASSMPLSFKEFSLINISIFKILLALALFEIIHELAFISFSVMSNHLSVSTRSIIDELALIYISICERQLPVSCHFILQKSTLVNVLVRPDIFSTALHHTFMHFALINITIFEVIFALSMLFTITCFSFVNSVVILDRFFKKLKCITNSFLTKNFFGEILELPKNYFEGPICNFFCGNIRKFSVSDKDIQFLNSERAILIFLELLQGFDSLIDVLSPSEDIIDYLLNYINVICLEVYFSQRLDVILSLFNKQSVARFSIFLQLIDCFVDIVLEISADPLDKFIEFDEVIVFSKFFLDVEVFWSGWPVIHFPKISLFKLLDGDKVVFALFVGEFCQANGAQQRAFSTSWIETDDLDLLVFMLLVHANQLRFQAQLRLRFHFKSSNLNYKSLFDFYLT